MSEAMGRVLQQADAQLKLPVLPIGLQMLLTWLWWKPQLPRSASSFTDPAMQQTAGSNYLPASYLVLNCYRQMRVSQQIPC